MELLKEKYHGLDLQLFRHTKDEFCSLLPPPAGKRVLQALEVHKLRADPPGDEFALQRALFCVQQFPAECMERLKRVRVAIVDSGVTLLHRQEGERALRSRMPGKRLCSAGLARRPLALRPRQPAARWSLVRAHRSTGLGAPRPPPNP